ncbi:hypothetical protein JL722_1636 [Aureococcus anophagefferens]|nr:hypothetical protein JL722_1636 [Aureococcus anophagefferens]
MMVRIAALCTLAGAAALSVSRAPLKAPLLSSPVYSLATLNGDDSTNMNICTYATPVGIRPQRRWTLSLYRGTRSHANFAARRGVLQLLREAHAPATHAGRRVRWRGSAPSTRAAREALGLDWEACGDWDERVLPGCAAYLRLVAVDGSVDCGDHEVFICRVAGGFGDAGNHLTTGELRRLGLITAKGAAVEPAAAFAPAPAAAFHQPAFAPEAAATIREQGEPLRPDTETSEQAERTPAPPAVEAEAEAAPPPEASSDSDVVDVEFAGAQTNGVAAAKLQDLPDDDDDLKGFLLEALKAVAKAKGVDVSACSEKADLVAAIRAAPAAAEPSNSTASGLDLGAGDYDGVLNYYENVAVRRLTKQMVARVLQAANHYDVLGVEVAAGTDVKVAYRDLALLVHPDKCGADGAAEAFQKINEANEVLGDSAKRATYDAALGSARTLLCTLTGAAALAAPVSRAPLEAPLLDAPVYSLATLNGDGSSNMNIVTYASPVGIRPERRWTLSLYRGTRSHANFAARRRGVLQLLREAHAPATHALGGVSAAKDDAVDKAAACEALGLGWEACGDWDERVLPGCAVYLRLEAVDAPWTAATTRSSPVASRAASATAATTHDRRAPPAGAHHGKGRRASQRRRLSGAPAAAFAAAPAAAFAGARRRPRGPAAVAPRRGRGGLRGGRRRRAAVALAPPLQLGECRRETNALYSTRTCLKYGRDKDGRLRSCLPSENCVSTSAVKSPAQFSPWAYTPTTSDAKVAFAELPLRR